MQLFPILICILSHGPDEVALKDIVDVVVHMAPVTQTLDSPVSVAVSGPGRKMPDAKDSQWARDREALEAELPAGATEGLLCTADGAVLESFVSNFFVVRGESLLPCLVYSHLNNFPLRNGGSTPSVILSVHSPGQC